MINSTMRPVLGLEVVFDNGRIDIHRKDAALMEDFKAKLPTWHRMIATLRSGPMTQAALASELEVSGDTIKKAVQRSRNTFIRIEGSDGITRIALAERGGR
jgi:predicted DNA-binding transcriptional regulator YafY